MMLFSARDNNILSFVCVWLVKRNQYEFRKHPKIKWLDEGFEPPTSGLPVHCSSTGVGNLLNAVCQFMNNFNI